MGLFETGFRIIISVMVISELAVDLSYLISQTEVNEEGLLISFQMSYYYECSFFFEAQVLNEKFEGEIEKLKEKLKKTQAELKQSGRSTGDAHAKLEELEEEKNDLQEKLTQAEGKYKKVGKAYQKEKKQVKH